MVCKHKVDAEAIRDNIMNQVECIIFSNVPFSLTAMTVMCDGALVMIQDTTTRFESDHSSVKMWKRGSVTM